MNAYEYEYLRYVLSRARTTHTKTNAKPLTNAVVLGESEDFYTLEGYYQLSLDPADSEGAKVVTSTEEYPSEGWQVRSRLDPTVRLVRLEDSKDPCVRHLFKTASMESPSFNTNIECDVPNKQVPDHISDSIAEFHSEQQSRYHTTLDPVKSRYLKDATIKKKFSSTESQIPVYPRLTVPLVRLEDSQDREVKNCYQMTLRSLYPSGGIMPTKTNTGTLTHAVVKKGPEDSYPPEEYYPLSLSPAESEGAKAVTVKEKFPPKELQIWLIRLEDSKDPDVRRLFETASIPLPTIKMNTGTEDNIVFRMEPTDTIYPPEEYDWQLQYLHAFGKVESDDVNGVDNKIKFAFSEMQQANHSGLDYASRREISIKPEIKEETVDLDTLTNANADNGVGDTRYAQVWKVSSIAINGLSDHPEEPSGAGESVPTPSASGHLKGPTITRTEEKVDNCEVSETSLTTKDTSECAKKILTGEKRYHCDLCEKVFGTKQCLVQHKRVHSRERPFRCQVCEKMFVQSGHLTAHMITHTREPYRCDLCKKVLSTKMSLVQHMWIHTWERPYRCKVCPKVFVRSTDLTAHMITHTREPYRCDLCKKVVSTKNSLVQHMGIHTWEVPVPCKVCPKVFIQSADLTAHMITHTREPYCCDLCKNVFSTKKSLVQHMGIHTWEGPIPCKVCPMVFVQSADLTAHMITHTREPYCCDLCKNVFSTKKSLVQHMGIHIPFRCKVCAKTFIQSAHLAAHMMTHTRPFRCELCEKLFISKHFLVIHMTTHTRKMPYRCEVCNKQFKTIVTFVNHMRLHNRDEWYRCKVWEKIFARKPSLVNHMMIHPGVKPFQCAVCEKVFADLGNIETHIITHYGERTYRCQMCEKELRSRAALLNHLRIHTVETGYRCEVCEKVFRSKQYLKIHMRIHTERYRSSLKFAERYSVANRIWDITRGSTLERGQCKVYAKTSVQLGHLKSHLMPRRTVSFGETVPV